MKRPILIHPDPRLRKVCDPVADLSDDLRSLAEDMLETMYAAPGIGLAAPQVGVTQRLIVPVEKATWLDQNGNPQEEEFDGLWSTCVQHEIDHLDGKLFIDYLKPLKRQLITRKMQKLKREKAREKA